MRAAPSAGITSTLREYSHAQARACLTVIQRQFAQDMPARKGRIHNYKSCIRKATLKSSGSSGGGGIAIAVVQGMGGGSMMRTEGEGGGVGGRTALHVRGEYGSGVNNYQLHIAITLVCLRDRRLPSKIYMGCA